MIEFVKFEEENDHEGETWTFWLQVTGNEGELAKLEDLIKEYEEAQGSDSEYQLDIMTQLSEEHVDVLVEHGGQGYMNYHQKVVGVLTVPDDLLEDGEYGKNLDGLYKGGVKKLFTSDGSVSL